MAEIKRFENIEKLFPNSSSNTNIVGMTEGGDVAIGIKDDCREVSIMLRKASVNEEKEVYRYRVNIQIIKSSKKVTRSLGEYLSALIIFNGSGLIEEADNQDKRTYEIDDYIQKDFVVKLNFDIEILFTKINENIEPFLKLFDEHKSIKSLLPIAFGVFGFEEMNKMIDGILSGESNINEVVELIELNCDY